MTDEPVAEGLPAQIVTVRRWVVGAIAASRWLVAVSPAILLPYWFFMAAVGTAGVGPATCGDAGRRFGAALCLLACWAAAEVAAQLVSAYRSSWRHALAASTAAQMLVGAKSGAELRLSADDALRLAVGSGSAASAPDTRPIPGIVIDAGPWRYFVTVDRRGRAMVIRAGSGGLAGDGDVCRVYGVWGGGLNLASLGATTVLMSSAMAGAGLVAESPLSKGPASALLLAFWAAAVALGHRPTLARPALARQRLQLLVDRVELRKRSSGR
jgi:hypothetical protein